MRNEYLDKIFPHDGIFEILLGTTGVRPNLSPIGIRREGESLRIKVYEGTLTLSNLRLNPKCTINVTSSPEAFFRWLAGEDIPSHFIQGIPYLPGTTSLLATSSEEGGNPPTFVLSVGELVSTSLPSAYSRGDSLFIDLLVHSTRLEIFDEHMFRLMLPVMKYELETTSRLSPQLRPLVEKLEKEIREVVRRRSGRFGSEDSLD